MAPPTATHSDPGLQPERTTLAWSRTILSLCLCAVLFARWIPEHGVWALMPGAAALLGGSALIGVRRRAARRSVRSIADEESAPSTIAVGGLTVLVVLVGLAAIAIVLADVG